jgi:hypothetical protein
MATLAKVCSCAFTSWRVNPSSLYVTLVEFRVCFILITICDFSPLEAEFTHTHTPGKRQTCPFLWAVGGRWFSTDGKLPRAQCTSGQTGEGGFARQNGGPSGTAQKGGPQSRRATVPYIGEPMQHGSHGPRAQPPSFGTGGRNTSERYGTGSHTS